MLPGLPDVKTQGWAVAVAREQTQVERRRRRRRPPRGLGGACGAFLHWLRLAVAHSTMTQPAGPAEHPTKAASSCWHTMQVELQHRGRHRPLSTLQPQDQSTMSAAVVSQVCAVAAAGVRASVQRANAGVASPIRAAASRPAQRAQGASAARPARRTAVAVRRVGRFGWEVLRLMRIGMGLQVVPWWLPPPPALPPPAVGGQVRHVERPVQAHVRPSSRLSMPASKQRLAAFPTAAPPPPRSARA